MIILFLKEMEHIDDQEGENAGYIKYIYIDLNVYRINI